MHAPRTVRKHKIYPSIASPMKHSNATRANNNNNNIDDGASWLLWIDFNGLCWIHIYIFDAVVAAAAAAHGALVTANIPCGQPMLELWMRARHIRIKWIFHVGVWSTKIKMVAHILACYNLGDFEDLEQMVNGCIRTQRSTTGTYHYSVPTYAVYMANEKRKIESVAHAHDVSHDQVSQRANRHRRIFQIMRMRHGAECTMHIRLHCRVALNA